MDTIGAVNSIIQLLTTYSNQLLVGSTSIALGAVATCVTLCNRELNSMEKNSRPPLAKNTTRNNGLLKNTP